MVMKNYKRTLLQKLRLLLFHKDERVTQGAVYSEVRRFDFSSYYPLENYVQKVGVPQENVYDIRSFGAVPENEDLDCAHAINAAIFAAEQTGGTVLIRGGKFTSGAVYLKSGITLFIAAGSSVHARKDGNGYPEKALVYAEDAENITITGGGTLNGEGNFFGRKPIAGANRTKPDTYVDVVKMRSDYRK